MSAETLRHIAIDDAQRQPLDDRGLADAGFADQHRIVLGATGQHLDGAADFLVAADHRIELAVAGGLGQVAGIFLECVIGIFGRRRVRGAALAQGFNGRVQILRRDPGAGQNFPRLVVLLDGERQQQPLDRHEGIAGFFRRLLRGLEHARKRRIHIKLPGTTAGYLGPLRQCRLDGGQSFTRMTSRAVDQSGRQTLRIVEQHLEQMFRRELLVTLPHRERLGRLHETAGAFGIFFKVHV